MGNILLFPTIIMKFFAIAALFAAVEASAGTPPAVGLGHAYIPANREDYDNAKELWGGDWAKYRAAHPNDQDCGISESDNWRVPNSALNPGSAEVPDFAREVDGASDTTDAREPHSQTRPQDSPRITEQAGRAAKHPVNRYV